MIEVKGANPDVFMNEVWEFEDGRYSVEGLGLSGKYRLGTDGNNTTITLLPNNKVAARGADIYKVQENGKLLVMKLGDLDNDKPNHPKDFTTDITCYDVYVCEKQ